jgi:16S rRNA (uracil1498-N3)-methyltransferase
MKRWRRIVIDAFKQSGRSYLPVLHEPVKLSDCLEKWQADLTLVLDEAGKANLRDVIASGRAGQKTCLFFVGPEGGWDERDRELFDIRKIPRVGLGQRILRTETAPVALLAILQYEMGDLA